VATEGCNEPLPAFSENNGGRVETQPRFKIQYPMKNRCKDALYYKKRCTIAEKFYHSNSTK
jgi:hypothetical protein